MPSCNDPTCHCNIPIQPPNTVPCKYCGEPTLMKSTKLCEWCYSIERCLPRQIKHPKMLTYVLSLLPRSAEEKFDPSVDPDLECAECGHTYERHFDTYDDMESVGCKYCICTKFKFGN